MNITGSFKVERSEGLDSIHTPVGAFSWEDSHTKFSNYSFSQSSVGYELMPVSFDASRSWTGELLNRSALKQNNLYLII